MFNNLRSGFNKRNKITNITNITISDDNSFDLITLVHKQKEASGDNDEDLEAMRLSLLEDIGVSAPKKEIPKSDSKFGILEDWAAKRKEAKQLSLNKEANRSAQSYYDKILIDGVETLDFDDEGMPALIKTAVPEEVKSLFEGGIIPSEEKIAKLAKENPAQLKILQKIKNAFGDKQNVEGSKYNSIE